MQKTEARDTEARDTEARDTEARDTEARDTEARDTEARDTEARDTEARDTEAREKSSRIQDFGAFTRRVDYSLLDTLSADPESTEDGDDHRARQVRSGHYVPVRPTPIASSEYIAHSRALFDELDLDQDLAHDDAFRRFFSGDISVAPEPMRPFGWATGYALSIYGTEYTQQCPFRNGNGYGDGRAISVFEGLFQSGRWELQLKGGGPTPYCRGADGRATLRSSVREFLAQEYMHALGVPTSRSLTLYTSRAETIYRPWYSEGSSAFNPDILVENSVAITTRVASSFLRVGQVELFARRARSEAHPRALQELRAIVAHLIEREYRAELDVTLNFNDQIIKLAECFRARLVSLVAHWIRVGYCQGNFNSDNCAAGGFTLDYGPFGFCEPFNPRFQPWTGGGEHFSFLNQPAAAEMNFNMFGSALRLLLKNDEAALNEFDLIREGFPEAMGRALKFMWARKLGLVTLDEALLSELLSLMTRSRVDYTLFFRELSHLPDELAPLKRSFYTPDSDELDDQWRGWLTRWRARVTSAGDPEATSQAMKQVNPSVAWREWLVAPAYQRAERGDYSLIHQLQEVFSRPYDELSQERAAQYQRLRPRELLNAGGISHYSCSS